MTLDKDAFSVDELWSLLELSTEGVWLYDFIEDDIRWSPSLLRALDVETSARDRLSLLELTHPQDRQRHADAIAAHLDSGGLYSLEVRMRRGEDNYRWYLARGFTITDADGKARKMLGFVVDIDEVYKQRDALASSEARFRAFMDNCPAAVFLKDADGAHLYANTTAADLADTTVGLMIGRANRDIFPEPTARALDAVDREVLSTKKRHSWVGQLSRSDGEPRWVHDVKFPVPYADGMTALGGFGIDITDLKKSQETVDAIRRLETVGRLAGGVAHDFNNMLGVILGFSEIAMANTAPDHPAHESLQEIVKAANKSIGITKQLLGFARKQTIRPSTLDLDKEVNRLKSILGHLAGDGVRLTKSDPDALWPVKLDPAQLDQVLTNLCINAKDAMPEGRGDIHIGLENVEVDADFANRHGGFAAGDYVVLSVSDNGSGIETDDFEQLFEPFYTSKRAGEGTGLGLATVYGIVKQNNGQILVDSGDSGTRFSIYLPRHHGEASSEDSDRPAAKQRDKRPHVLIVEDEAALLSMLQRMLESLDYEVSVAESAGTALEALETQQVDVLLSDIVMPEMNGVELSRTVRTRYPDMRILLMSGHADRMRVDTANLDENIGFIQKPFTRNEISNGIAQLLQADQD